MTSLGSNKARIEVMNPVAEARPRAVMPARRLDTLNDKKIALWWNTKSHGDVALSAAAEAIGQRFKNVTFTRVTRQLDQRPGPYDEILKSGCDAVIASTGD
ncbi:MAG: hypothetical protein HYX92_20825 [Chloroflexi bacterium]|nr:hypothetical protein [Chloroflexota bacterium]